MKKGKSSGLGEISLELIKYGVNRMNERIRNFIDTAVKCCKVPKNVRYLTFIQYGRKQTNEIPKIIWE